MASIGDSVVENFDFSGGVSTNFYDNLSISSDGMTIMTYDYTIDLDSFTQNRVLTTKTINGFRVLTPNTAGCHPKCKTCFKPGQETECASCSDPADKLFNKECVSDCGDRFESPSRHCQDCNRNMSKFALCKSCKNTEIEECNVCKPNSIINNKLCGCKYGFSQSPNGNSMV